MVDYEKLKQARNMGFIKDIGVETVELREGYAKVRLFWMSVTQIRLVLHMAVYFLHW